MTSLAGVTSQLGAVGLVGTLEKVILLRHVIIAQQGSSFFKVKVDMHELDSQKQLKI